MADDEVEPEDVVELDVEQAAGDQEDARRHEQEEVEALEAVGERVQGRPFPELGDYRPQLGEQQRHRGETGDDVKPLV